jgi:hypothetical protein
VGADLSARSPGVVARFDAWSARVSERLDAVLVKDVRQALRSRFFRVNFGIALVLTTLGGLFTLVLHAFNADTRAAGGMPLFVVVAACASVGAIGLVPFAAFASMSAESDESALDLLNLSHLTPLAIARGKLVTALLQALLVDAVCLPYVVVAWSMGNVDPLVVGSTLANMLAMSAALSAIGIATSSLTRVRWVRVLLMVVFGFFVYSFGSYALILLLLGFLGGPFASSGAASFTLFMFTWAAMLAALVPIGVAFAADRIAHRETSTSTPLRVVASSIALLGALVDVVWIATQGSDHSATIVALVCALLAFPLMWVVAERETLPLAVRALPPRGGWRGWLAIPHLAGGGRGALLASLTIGFVCAVHFVACVTEHGKLDDDAVAGLAYGAFTWWYLLLPSGLLAPFSARPGVTGITRVAIVFVPLLLLLGTVLIGAMLSLRSPAPSVLDAVNPSALVRDLRSNGQPSNSGPWIALGLIVTVTFFLNVWRMLRGVREVRRVQREQRIRARVAGSA